MTRQDFQLPQPVQDATTSIARLPTTSACSRRTTHDRRRRSFTPRTPIYRRYRTWTEANGYQPSSAGSFYDQLAACAVETLGAPSPRICRTACAASWELTCAIRNEGVDTDGSQSRFLL